MTDRAPTARDLEVLDDLDHTNHRAEHPVTWATPLEIGGSTRSKERSYRLTKLVSMGLAERKQRGASAPGVTAHDLGLSRGSWAYRITEAGCLALAQARSRP